MFKTCNYCGANLDPGEKCDCDRVHEKNKKIFSKLINTDSYQYELKMERKMQNGIYV